MDGWQRIVPADKRHSYGCSIWCHHCAYCLAPLSSEIHLNRPYCGNACRQKAYRERKARE